MAEVTEVQLNPVQEAKGSVAESVRRESSPTDPSFNESCKQKCQLPPDSLPAVHIDIPNPEKGPAPNPEELPKGSLSGLGALAAGQLKEQFGTSETKDQGGVIEKGPGSDPTGNPLKGIDAGQPETVPIPGNTESTPKPGPLESPDPARDPLQQNGEHDPGKTSDQNLIFDNPSKPGPNHPPDPSGEPVHQ